VWTITSFAEGDRNTKYFHRKAMWHETKNKIKKVINHGKCFIMFKKRVNKLCASSSQAYSGSAVDGL
jgi:hypothetical protein